MADTVDAVDVRLCSGRFVAGGDAPDGVPIDDGTMKSSRFMWSSSDWFACSDVRRSCWAIPLGGFLPSEGARRLNWCQRNIFFRLLYILTLAVLIPCAANS